MATVTKGVLKLHTKWTARRLAADAMFAAMVTVLAAAAIKTGNLKITIEAMPVFLGALMLGPVDGMVIGGIGTLLAAFGLLNAFQGFLSLMSALIPPLAGVLIASYWIVGKGKRENFSPRPGFSAVGVISFAVGAVFACITGGTFASFPGLVEALPFLNWPFFVGPVNGIVVSLVLYVGLAKLTSAKPMPAKQTA